MTYSADDYRDYRQTQEGQSAIRKYEQSEAAKRRRDKYRQSEQGRKKSRERDAARKQRNREIVRTAKQRPCADCAQSFDPICMDFHHINGDKRFTIGWGRNTTPMLEREIAKCIVLCANCHRLRHKKG